MNWADWLLKVKSFNSRHDKIMFVQAAILMLLLLNCVNNKIALSSYGKYKKKKWNETNVCVNVHRWNIIEKVLNDMFSLLIHM